MLNGNEPSVYCTDAWVLSNLQ